MAYIGNAPAAGIVDSGSILNGSINTEDLADAAVTAAKLAATAITSKLGYTPLNKAGDTMSGPLGLKEAPDSWPSSWGVSQFLGGNSVWGVQGQFQLGYNNYYDGSQYIRKNADFAARYMMQSGRHSWDVAPSGAAGSAITFDNAFAIEQSGVLNAVKGQIKFPATQNASSDANTLDDYEEGTFTPAITLSSGSATYVGRNGRYIKIGKVVNFWVDIAFTAAAGAIITNLENFPFSIDGTVAYPMIPAGNAYWIDLRSGGTTLGVYPMPNSNYMRFHTSGNNTDQMSPLTTSLQMNIRIAGAYYAAA